MRSRDAALARLLGDGVVRRDGGRLRTARRFQTAMARAAAHLYGKGDPGEDLRVPVAFALLDIYGEDVTDDDLAELVELMTAIEAAELSVGAPVALSGGDAPAPG